MCTLDVSEEESVNLIPGGGMRSCEDSAVMRSSAKPVTLSRSAKLIMGCFTFINFFLLLCRSYDQSQMDGKVSKTEMMGPRSSPTEGWVRPDKIFGLVHMAKTAGTEINGELANHFERVCGDKGYSYDAYQTNLRFREKAEEEGGVLVTTLMNDSVSKLFPKGRVYNRGLPPHDWMKEIGFEDCDYVALEAQAVNWKRFAGWGLELHVPCRDPLSHLMSNCNFRELEFVCDEDRIEQEVNKCLNRWTAKRFDPLIFEIPNTTVKCFDPIPIDPYIDYMGTILQRKRIESDYFHRASNKPRHKEQECLWNQSDDFKERVKQAMMKQYPYYEFCDKCMGSTDELPL